MIRELIVKYRRLFIAGIHFLAVIFAYTLSFYLRFEFKIPEQFLRVMLMTLPVVLFIKILMFYVLGLFHSSMRYASIIDLWQVVKANTYSSMCLILLMFFVHEYIIVPRSVFVVDWILCLGLTSGMRFLARFLRERVGAVSASSVHNALIIGAGDSGSMVLKEYRNNPHSKVNIIGFIDDDRTKKNMRIQGVPVFGGRELIPDLSERFDVEEIVIAIPSAKGEVVRDLLSSCQIPGVKVKIVPGLHRILNGELEVKPRDVEPEDLLGREVVEIDEHEVGANLSGKRVLVTGAGGSIGSELCRQIASFNPSLIVLFDHDENSIYFLKVELETKYSHLALKVIVGDIKDAGLLKHVFTSYRPQLLFHAAAHKHVPLMEECPSAAVKNNIIGSRNLMYAAHHYGVRRFVLISTDKAVNPTSIMGASKRVSEMIMQAKAKKSRTKFMAVRFGNVLGSAGSVVPLFKKQIAEGGPVTVTHPEVRRYFMSIREAVKLVLQAAVLGEGGEIFVLDMGEQIKVVDLARNLVILSGLRPDKDIPIEFIGLRSGEKLYEEILHDAEQDRATKHDKIYITKTDHLDPGKVRSQVKDLERLAHNLAEKEIVKKMKKIIPVYTPCDKTDKQA